MSHITLAQQGIEAGERRDWPVAITKLTSALKVSLNPSWLIHRSKALAGQGRFPESLADADLAWHAALSRSKRELIADANYRRAVAYNRMGRYADAACCCAYAMRILKDVTPLTPKEDPNREWMDTEGRCVLRAAEVKAQTAADPFNVADKGSEPSLQPASAKVRNWRMASVMQLQALTTMERLPEDDPGRKITVTQVPQKRPLSDLGAGENSTPTTTTTGTATAPKPSADTPGGAGSATAPPRSVPVDLKSTPRLGDYQNDKQMSVTVFSKGVKKDKLVVDFLPFSVQLDPIVYPSGEERSYTLDLWGEIDPAKCKYTVTPSKVELVLAKKVPEKWPQALKYKSSEDEKATEQSDESKMSAPAVKPVTTSVAPPTTETPAAEKVTSAEGKEAAVTSYPTSSRKGPKNWDKLDDGDDSDDGSNVNDFFKKLYKGATPEQQRAMMKSFTESNGTSLSTDWDDVKSRTVETVPPEGVEAKKWT